MNSNVTKLSPEIIRYRGDQIVLIQEVPSEFGPGAFACFDLDCNGRFERQVCGDNEGLYTIALDAKQLPNNGKFFMSFRSENGKKKSEKIPMLAIQEDFYNPAAETPVYLVPGEKIKPVPEICTCTACPTGDTLTGSSLEAYTHSFTPTEHDVELATGLSRQSFPVTSFSTRMLGFNFAWHHSSLVDYKGPWGLGGSHSFNMMIVQTGRLTGEIITPDLRCYYISSKDGLKWFLPRGFFSKLQLDPKHCRWTMTHFSGLQVQFFQGALHRPGYPISIADPNRNAMRLNYDASGLLQSIVTDLGQTQKLAFDAAFRLHSFTDHIRRTWSFRYDSSNRLTAIVTPATEFAYIASGQEITDGDLPNVVVTQPRTMTLTYGNDRFPSHITAITDQRGATPDARVYDDRGRVKTALINGKPVEYFYGVEFSLPILEDANMVTRTVDREGNVTDWEIHGQPGGPVDGKGRFGLRRKITWTERGKGNGPLRADEPEYWEQRWLHDCDCLSPNVLVQPFSSEDAMNLTFDNNGIPKEWPRTIYTHNRNRQVTVDLYTDGSQSIRKESTYQDGAFGQGGQFSRLLTWTDPRAFDRNSIYAGLNFTHRYEYDERGNRIRHNAPAVTRGVDAPQVIAESWTYNQFGQPLQHIDANGNVTVNSYFQGPSTGGDINTKGEFGGYLASTTAGAEGSQDAPTNLTTSFNVNALGMTTRRTDPKGFTYDIEFNNLQEKIRWIEPPVTLRNGRQIRYETRCIYDGAGNKVMERRSNIDLDGSTPANAWIDRSMSYDDVNNLLSQRVEVDENNANDLVSRNVYDRNDDLAITQKPEGNRQFVLYDERRLRLKTFYGIAPSTRIDDGYPLDKRAEDLGGTGFVGFTIDTYDARFNYIRHRDGRGNFTNKFYDFYNRQIAESDPNGNGWAREFDDASNVLTTERGAVDPATRLVIQPLERTYGRYDEIGRQYQQVLDIDLMSDERAAVDPDDGLNSNYRTLFDPGSRTVQVFDANGNPESYAYDAANRTVTVTDALGNLRAHTYDANSNLISVSETELPGPDSGGAPETYVTTFVFDEINRRTEQHLRGLNGNSIDHAWFFAYDSRNNQRLGQDAENNFTLITFDDADRMIIQQRFDDYPLMGSAKELLHSEWAYDRNNRVVQERALSDVTAPASAQITRHAYDDLDRRVRTVFPDSDDPIDGSGNGPDGIFDRLELTYDPNSNLIRMVDQREVVFVNTFDPGNRLTIQEIARTPTVPGTSRQVYVFDSLNRIASAGNNFALVEQNYDPLSRLTRETQSIRLDGSGFTRGWESPIQLVHAYDRQSNKTLCQVLDGTRSDLAVSTTFDALNRTARIAAEYFDAAMHGIATYAYLGPWRVQTKTLGNGAALTRLYDVKRRPRAHQWTGPVGLLVGFEYDYDRMDNVLFERFTHDNGLFDHFQYNERYEVIGVEYRAPGATPPVNPRTRFFYNDVYNRTQASFGDPFGERTDTLDSYTANRANEYSQIKRNGRTIDFGHDRAGNMTRLLVQPVISGAGRSDALATARWDALNLLFDIDTEVTPRQDYRYDPLRRRIASLELGGPNGNQIQPGSRRFIYCGWEDVEERLFDSGATLASAPSRLERIYVNGREIDEPLLTAIDTNGDGKLGGSVPKNLPDVQAEQEYYFLNNRLGSIMALLDADQGDRVLEYYRYSVYGEPAVLQAIDMNRDRSEETPFDLADNFNRLTAQSVSAFGNTFAFTSRRFDSRTGLYYYRHRYYDPRNGRFLSRDPQGYHDGLNLYSYVHNNPVNLIDPLGLRWLYLQTYKLFSKTLPPKYVNDIEDAQGKTEVFYQIFLCCECFEGNTWRMKIRYGIVYQILLEHQLKADEEKRSGVYGHELQHVKAIEEALQSQSEQLRATIRNMEEKRYTNQPICDTQIKYARKIVERELLKVIDRGAGHDDDPNTVKPAKSELIRPGDVPGTFQDETEICGETKKISKLKYEKYDDSRRP